MNVGACATASTWRSKGSLVESVLSFSLCVRSGIDLKLSSLCLGKRLLDELSPLIMEVQIQKRKGDSGFGQMLLLTFLLGVSLEWMDGKWKYC